MWGGATPFPGLFHFTLDPYLIMLSVKQGSIKYNFWSLWYDATWDWNPVSRTIGEHSTIWGSVALDYSRQLDFLYLSIYIYIYNAIRRKTQTWLNHYKFISAKNIIILIIWLHTFNLRLKNSKYGLQSIYMFEKKRKKERKTSINLNSPAKVERVKPGKECSCKITHPNLNIC